MTKTSNSECESALDVEEINDDEGVKGGHEEDATQLALATEGESLTVSMPQSDQTRKRKATSSSSSCFNIEDDGADEEQRPQKNKRGGGRTPDNTLWMEMYEDLCEFYKLHGHCRVPSRRSYSVNPGLAQWVSTQRENYRRYQKEEADPQHKNHAVGKGRIELLNAIHFVWKLESRTTPWETKFQELLEFKRLNGHVDVPTKHKQLGRWVDTQRYHYKLYNENRPTRMTPEKIQQLNSIGGWNWKLKEQQKWDWNELYNKLVEYHSTHGHSMVPKLYALDRRLGLFVQKQRSAHKAGNLSEERISLLERIDFQWVVRDRSGKGKGVGAMKRSAAQLQQQQRQREQQQREQELRAALAEAEQEAHAASEQLRQAAALAKKTAQRVQQLQAELQRVGGLHQQAPQQVLQLPHDTDVDGMLAMNNGENLDGDEHDENAIVEHRVDNSALQAEEDEEDLYADYRQPDHPPRVSGNDNEAMDRSPFATMVHQQPSELQQHQMNSQLLLGQQQQQLAPTNPDELGPYGYNYPY